MVGEALVLRPPRFERRWEVGVDVLSREAQHGRDGRHQPAQKVQVRRLYGRHRNPPTQSTHARAHTHARTHARTHTRAHGGRGGGGGGAHSRRAAAAKAEKKKKKKKK